MTPRTLSTATLFVTAALAGISSADVVTSTYNSSSSYEFEVQHMPDFDQVREGLADDGDGDPGGMYCVPTALTNLLGYIGNHGFPDAGPDSADWEADEDYDLVTAYISNMAALAGTSGTGGTYHQPAYDAMVYFLNAREPGVFTVTENLATNTSGPTLRSIVDNDVNGAITSFCYGIYDDIGNDVWGRKVLDRNGGHCVTMVRGYRDGSTREIEYMDPDDSSDETTQSTFSAEEFDVESVNYVKANTLFGASFRGCRNGSRIMRTTGGKFRMIDSVIHVRPRSGYSWDSSENQWVIHISDLIGPWYSQPSPVPGPVGINPSNFTIGPMNNTLWCLDQNDRGKAYSVRMSNHEVNTFDLPHASHQLAFARDHALIALGDGLLSRVHPFSEGGENAPQPLTLQVPSSTQYMAMGNQSDVIWLAAPESRDLLRMPQRFDAPPAVISLARDFPANAIIKGIAASDCPPWSMIAVLDSDGRIHVCKVDNDQLVTIGQIWTDGTIHSLQFNDEGDVLAFGDNGMSVYRSTEGDWHQVTDHAFAGRQFAANSVMSRSSTNFDVVEHGGDEWRQIRDTESTPGDLDGDGVVAVSDLLELISFFGEQSNSADLDGDGLVGINDMLILLGNWSE
ncbi:MAG: hypothetical protein HOI89_07220 [Phycisphaerae bacterium]|nr:hypothetical protein [Phycisphaerae bacterium]